MNFLVELPRVFCNGYIEKDDGESLLNLVDDGNKHRVTITLELIGPTGNEQRSTSAKYGMICSFQKGWHD